MNWKAVVGVSMLCITMMTGCEEKKICRIIYGEKGLSSLPIQDIAGEHIDTDNEYMYYYSVEFIK